ncbi:unnamed protein product [Trichobilharzia szidati]|nr:unnamed protein product [Trichobilharzia szidati]
MNLKSNVDINYNNTDDDNKSKFLETMKSIIKKDDADQLLNILTDRRWDINTTNISTNEEDKINPMEKQSHSSHILLKNEDKANLLHLAVVYNASACVEVLVNPPYMWSSYFENTNGETTMKLAEQHCCLKLQYSIAAKLSKYAIDSEEFSHRSLSALLLYPQAFIEQPFSFDELFTWNRHGVMPGSAVEHLNNGINNQSCSFRNFSLLFELTVATPEICPTIYFDSNEIRDFLNDIKEFYQSSNKLLYREHYYAAEHHFSTIFSEHMRVTHKWDEIWNKLFYTWLFNRTVMQGNRSTNLDDISTFMYIKQPFELQAICRITLRRLAVEQKGR